MAKLGGFVVALAALSIMACTQTGQGGGMAGTGSQPAVPPPGLTVTQAAAYCTTLGNTYATYVGTVGAYLGSAAGIPVLQEKLRDNRVTVPPPPTG